MHQCENICMLKNVFCLHFANDVFPTSGMPIVAEKKQGFREVRNFRPDFLAVSKLEAI